VAKGGAHRSVQAGRQPAGLRDRHGHRRGSLRDHQRQERKGAYIGAHTGAGLRLRRRRDRRDRRQDRLARRTNLTRRGSVARVITGAAIPFIAGGDAVKSDANGKAIPQGGTGVILGYFLGLNLTAGGNATAADQVAEIDLV
jgi:hypothetical protein